MFCRDFELHQLPKITIERLVKLYSKAKNELNLFDRFSFEIALIQISEKCFGSESGNEIQASTSGKHDVPQDKDKIAKNMKVLFKYMGVSEN